MRETVDAFRFETSRGSVSALWRAAPDAVAITVLAHGAGNDMRTPLLAGIAEGLAANGISSMRFNFPFTEQGRRSPDRPPVLMEAWRAALNEAGRRGEGLPLVAAGKSLGGRMASMVAAEEPGAFPAVAIVFFGYPLHAPGRPSGLRDAHLPQVPVPMLFIQGTADPLADFSLIQEVVSRLGAAARLHAVAGGDHSFRVRKARRPDPEIGEELGGVAAAFVRVVVG
jgi:predicted alpha/beta-hydrolase family hydrolase